MASEVIVKSTGQVFVRPQEIVMPGEYEVDIDPALCAVFGKAISLRVPSVAILPGPDRVWLDMTVTGDGTLYVSAPLRTLTIKTAFAIDGEKASPDFNCQSTPIAVEWQPEPDCGLIYAIRMNRRGPVWQAKQPYLFALDAKDATTVWHLPLPNLFSDCRVCTGLDPERPTTGETILDCYVNSLENFKASPWNGHLLPDNGDSQNVLALLRFKIAGKEFKTVPCPKWRELSKKVATDITRLVI